jgi:hypothetical protein
MPRDFDSRDPNPCAHGGAGALCGWCRIEEPVTDMICHPATSMLPLELILQVDGICRRCGGARSELS